MKPLNKYIKEKLIVFHPQVDEKLIVNKNYNPYKYHPKSFDELKEIIKKRYKEQGPGTEQDPINFNDIDVSGMTTFYNDIKDRGLFENTKFEYIDISDWDVSNVKELSRMFFRCKTLISVGDLSKWDVSNVKYMGNMFRYCENLTFVGDLSNWDVSNVTHMDFIFRDCHELEYIGDISKWDVSKAEYKLSMFNDSGITNIPDWYKE